ncbi:MAG: DUF5698 domain-containing protein [Bacilli bacterium]
MEILISSLIILIARIVDVSLGTLRTILQVKGFKLIVLIVAFVEISVWFLVARDLLSSDSLNVFNALAYALGFSIGSVLGGIIEEKIGIGKLSIQVIININKKEIIKLLRKSGFGVSVIKCEGQVSEKYMLFLEINRKSSKEVMKIIKDFDKSAFITTQESKNVINGYFKVKKTS